MGQDRQAVRCDQVEDPRELIRVRRAVAARIARGATQIDRERRDFLGALTQPRTPSRRPSTGFASIQAEIPRTDDVETRSALIRYETTSGSLPAQHW